MRTDGLTDLTKVTVASRNFSNASKKNPFGVSGVQTKVAFTLRRSAERKILITLNN